MPDFLSPTTSIRPAVSLTLYHGSSLSLAYNSDAKSLIHRAQPDAIELHASPMQHAAHFHDVVVRVRSDYPHARLWIGVGCDGWARNVADGTKTVSQVVAIFMDTARLAVDHGVELIKWDGEEAYTNAAVKRSGLARAIVSTCALFPSLVQGFTSYDHPTYHAIDWGGWIGPESPVALVFPQVYASGRINDLHPHRGALPKRKAQALESWALAVRKRLIKADVVPDVASDLDWEPYFQLYGTDTSDLVNAMCAYAVVSGWAAPTRTDQNGCTALVAACGLRRLGFIGVTAVRDFQTAYGLKVDGIVGPETLGKLRQMIGQVI